MTKKTNPSPSSKCYVSVNKPADTTITPHHFNSKVEILLPQELYEVIGSDLLKKLPQLTYHVLEMPLSRILEPDFFNKYIKAGNILLLSQGRIDSESVYSINDGILRLCLSQQVYETAGLVGQPSGFWPGRKKHRWIVERDLRSASFMTGGKSFERVKWSFTEVLKEPVRFLFCDLAQLDGPLKECQILKPLITKTVSPEYLTTPSLRIPDMAPPSYGPKKGTEFEREIWQEWALELNEWLGLASIPAQRLFTSDSVDSYLSTYTVDGEMNKPLQKLSWRGFIPAGWILKVWESLGKSMSHMPVRAENWAVMTVYGFDNAPVSWAKALHSNIMGGENGYGLLILPGPAVKSKESPDEMAVDRDESRDLLTFETVCSWDEHS